MTIFIFLVSDAQPSTVAQLAFFSSSSLIAVSKGLATLVQSGGKMRLVASPYLSREDIKAIEMGLNQREEVITGVPPQFQPSKRVLKVRETGGGYEYTPKTHKTIERAIRKQLD